MSAHFRPPSQFTKLIAATGTPERLSATNLPVSQCIIIGKKSARTDNTGNVYMGVTSTNDAQPIPIFPGGQYVLTNVDLYEWYFDTDNVNDGVIVIYW